MSMSCIRRSRRGRMERSCVLVYIVILSVLSPSLSPLPQFLVLLVGFCTPSFKFIICKIAMTTAQGTFKSCEDSYSLSFTCTGPSYSILEGFPDATCTHSEIPFPAAMASPAKALQPRPVSRTQIVNLGDCGSFMLTSDGTSGGTDTEIVEAGVGACASNITTNSASTYTLPSGTGGLVPSGNEQRPRRKGPGRRFLARRTRYRSSARTLHPFVPPRDLASSASFS